MTTEQIVSELLDSKCPKCGSAEIGYSFIHKQWNCWDCKHVWKNQPKN